jgi:hypothetical protein
VTVGSVASTSVSSKPAKVLSATWVARSAVSSQRYLNPGSPITAGERDAWIAEGVRAFLRGSRP